MSNTNRAYLLISGRLYSAHRQANDKASTACNLYPCALGTFTGHPVDLPPGTRHAVHGDTVDLFGRRYQVNDQCQPGRDFIEDEIDLELVLLGADPDAALLAAPAPTPAAEVDTDTHDQTCAACHAAYLIADALQIIKPDDSTVTSAEMIDCGTVRLSVLSDDAGDYIATVTVAVDAE